MEEKYNPVFLLTRATQYFEAMEGNSDITIEIIRKYKIEIEIKDSAEKYTIAMDKKGDILLLGAELRGLIKKHDDLEKNKDNLGAVIVNRAQKEPEDYPNLESFYQIIKK